MEHTGRNGTAKVYSRERGRCTGKIRMGWKGDNEEWMNGWGYNSQLVLDGEWMGCGDMIEIENNQVHEKTL